MLLSFSVAAVPSGYPQNFGILPLNSRSVFIEWEPPLITHQNGYITGYTLRWSSVNGPDVNENTTANTNITLSNLTPFTNYAWTIAASTIVGIGPFSTTVNFVMPEDGM